MHLWQKYNLLSPVEPLKQICLVHCHYNDSYINIFDTITQIALQSAHATTLLPCAVMFVSYIRNFIMQLRFFPCNIQLFGLMLFIIWPELSFGDNYSIFIRRFGLQCHEVSQVHLPWSLTSSFTHISTTTTDK